jgi:hypothetical protein
MGTGITTTAESDTKEKDIDSVVSDTNISSGAPMSDVGGLSAKESLPPPAPFTPVKDGRKHYRLLMPIIGAAVAAIIVLVLVSSSMQHQGGQSVQPAPNPSNIPPTVRTANGYSFIKKWGSNGTADGQFSSLSGVAVDSSGNVYATDTGNNRIQVFSPLSR